MENKAKIDALISKLNPEQLKPVLDTEGAVLVIAGAGSGKTRVLTTRIAHIVAEQRALPGQIMAITFTNKAAGEMKERLEKIVGDISEMWVSTIHSMCVRILRRDIDKIGYDKNFTIYDETDKDKVLKRVFDEVGLDPEKLIKPCKNYISKAKNECLDPEGFLEEYSSLRIVEEVYKVYKAYQNKLERSNSLDFDDLLFKTYELFIKCPQVADYYSNKFKYIHIDEFQDTNEVQFNIVARLALTHGNIFVVGDDDQSIYGWRGAKIENILNFDTLYPNAKVYKLERNYRSTKKILQLANCIIKNNTGRRDKELWTENGEGCRVETFVGNDENNEASFVALQIKNLMSRNSNLNYKDFAVFMRVNALSRAFEQEFTKYGIPYVVYGGFRFFERKEIKDVLAYLKLVNNFSDDESFMRAVSTPKRGIGEKTLRELSEFATSKGLPVLDAIDFIHETSLASGAKTKLVNFKKLILTFVEASYSKSVEELIKLVLDSTEFMLQFEEKTEENVSRKYNISELLNSAEQFSKDNPGTGLADYLNSVTLSSDTDGINDGNVVTIATIHSAKGLEYPCVFVAGCDEKILPVQRTIGDDDEIEEERRLMYVAVTRAKERLYLIRANSRYMYGNREYMVQSRFLKEAQSVLNPSQNADNRANSISNNYQKENSWKKTVYDDNDFGKSNTNVGGYSSNYAKSFLNNSKPKVVTNCANKYKTGVKVKHTKFGEGTVIMVKGSDDNIIVDVAFKGVGIKSLSAKYAPMEVL